MNWKILKKDFKRKKSMNIILLIFILLASLFSSSSLNNMVAALKGTDYFFQKAGMDDFIFLTMREGYASDASNEDKANEFLASQDTIIDYSADDCLYLAKSNITLPDEKEMEKNVTTIINCYDIQQQKFFDQNDKEIVDMEDGTIYLPLSFIKENDLSEGDFITLNSNNGYEKQFEIIGNAKDACMGADMMGAKRFIINQHDFNEILNNSDLPYGLLYSVQASDLKQLKIDFNGSGITTVFSADKALIKMTYFMDLVFALVLLVVSICLILISMIMLRFIITFTISEDFKEIGIMKAIGIEEKAIRKLYVSKYLVLAFVGSVLGFFIGIPFSRMLLQQISQNMVISNLQSGLILQLCSCIVVVLIICFFAYLCTRKVKKLSPMDAIRSGNSGERFKKKGVFHLNKSRLRATTFLAFNDVLSELKKYIIVLITSVVGIWLIVMPLNTINTLRSDKMIELMSFQHGDAWILEDAKATELIVKGEKQAFYDYLDEVKSNLQEHGIPVEETCIEIFFRYRIRKGDSSNLSSALQGLHTDITKYLYEDGSAPKYENEVALGMTTAREIGAVVGDTVYITMGEEERPFLVTALYQTMNNMGEGIRFHESVNIDYHSVAGTTSAEIMLEDTISQEEYGQYFEQMKELYPKALVQTSKEYVDSMVGSISSRLDSFKVLILAIVIAVNILVVVLMQKMFLIREKGQIAMMKSVGFSNAAIIRWQTKRIAVVLGLGIFLGILTGTPFSKLTAGQAFKIMGASRIEFDIKPMEVYIGYPACVLVATLLACILTMLRVRKLKVQEINNMD